MKCVVCHHGETRSGFATLTLERDGESILVQNVPADICLNCGEEYFSEAVTRQILSQPEQLIPTGKAAAIVRFLPTAP